MDVRGPILQVGRRVELPVLDLIDAGNLGHRTISCARLQGHSEMRTARFCSGGVRSAFHLPVNGIK
jgi:hypothetical protein